MLHKSPSYIIYSGIAANPLQYHINRKTAERKTLMSLFYEVRVSRFDTTAQVPRPFLNQLADFIKNELQEYPGTVDQFISDLPDYQLMFFTYKNRFFLFLAMSSEEINYTLSRVAPGKANIYIFPESLANVHAIIIDFLKNHPKKNFNKEELVKCFRLHTKDFPTDDQQMAPYDASLTYKIKTKVDTELASANDELDPVNIQDAKQALTYLLDDNLAIYYDRDAPELTQEFIQATVPFILTNTGASKADLIASIIAQAFKYIRIDYVSNQLIHEITANIAEEAIDPDRSRRKFNQLLKQINAKQ